MFLIIYVSLSSTSSTFSPTLCLFQLRSVSLHFHISLSFSVFLFTSFYMVISMKLPIFFLCLSLSIVSCLSLSLSPPSFLAFFVLFPCWHLRLYFSLSQFVSCLLLLFISSLKPSPFPFLALFLCPPLCVSLHSVPLVTTI